MSRCCGDCGHNKLKFPKLKVFLISSSSYLGTKQQQLEVIIIKVNVYIQLTLEIPGPEKMLEY